MEFAISIPQVSSTPDRIERFLRRAEELPFVAAWCMDQVIGTAPELESVSTQAFAAGVTTRLRLGIAVLIIAQRNPVDLAKALSSVDVLSKGRLVVGVGMGHGTRYYPAFGLAPEGRVARFRENLEIMKRLWTEERVSFNGRFARLEAVAMQPKPVQKPHPPIWFGGRAEAALRRAVELGDGYIGAGSTPLDTFLEDIRQLPADFPKAKRVYLTFGDDLARVRQWFATVYGKPDMADQVVVYGSPQQIAGQLVRLKNAGIKHVLLNPVIDEEEQMERLCEDVIHRV